MQHVFCVDIGRYAYMLITCNMIEKCKYMIVSIKGGGCQ